MGLPIIRASYPDTMGGRSGRGDWFRMKRAIEHLRRNDPVLGAIIERVGKYGIQYRRPEFESLVRSIVYQQLSGRVASVIFGRLAAAVHNQITPENILKLRPSRMRSLGL